MKIQRFFSCLICLFVFQSNAEVLHLSEQGFVIENRIETRQPVEKVWQALINDVDKWWPTDHTWWGEDGVLSIDMHAGGCFCEISGDKSAEHMRISFVEPNKLLRMTGGLGPLQGMGLHGALEWRFSQQDGKTRVVLHYAVSGFSPNGYEQLAPVVAKVQGLQLRGLKDFVDGR